MVGSRTVGLVNWTRGATWTSTAGDEPPSASRRYLVVRTGLTSAMTIPVLSNVTSVEPDQAAPSGDEASRGVPRPRTTPPSRDAEPNVTAVGVGLSSRSTPTAIHVERRPRAVRTSDAGTVSGPSVVWATSERRRPDGVAVAVTSMTRASTPSFDCSVRAPRRTGPQR